MSIFKRKSKAEKEETKEKKGEKVDKKKKKSVGAEKESSTITPTSQPYKHVPSHAAADAVPKVPGRGNGVDRKRISREAFDYAIGYAPPVNNAQVVQAPSSGQSTPLAPYRGFNGGSGIQRNSSAEVFITAPDAPPLPNNQPATRQQNNWNEAERPPRTNDGYYSSKQHDAPSYDSPVLGNPKMAAAAHRDRGYVNPISPHNSADSGYGSVVHSRTPSELNYGLDSISKPHLPQSDSGFLPELSLSEELAREPAFSESSFVDDEAQETHTVTSSQAENATSIGRSSKSYRISKAKQTRFGRLDESAQGDDRGAAQSEQLIGKHCPSHQLPELVQQKRPDSATLLQSRHVQSSTSTFGDFELPLHTSASVRQSTQVAQRAADPSTQVSSSKSPETEQRSLAERSTLSPPAAYQQTYFAPLTQINSLGGTLSSGSVEGLKVNKRGKVLDEEGEVIAELVEGDIMDCVRQRCNAKGEVLDDRGRVVGLVQIHEVTLDSPIARPSSSAMPTPPANQYAAYFPNVVSSIADPPPDEVSSYPVVSGSGRRASTTSQRRESFTPAWQHQSSNIQSGMAKELRDHMASAGGASQSAVQPLDLSTGDGVVELEAPETQTRVEEEELMPILDYSDIFMPPTTAERSAFRDETPTTSRPFGQTERTVNEETASKSSVVEPRSKPKKFMSTSLESQTYQTVPYEQMQQPGPEPDIGTTAKHFQRQMPRGNEVQESTMPAPTAPRSVAQWAAQLHSRKPKSSTPAVIPALESEQVVQQTQSANNVPSLGQSQSRPSATRISNSSMARPVMSPVPEDKPAEPTGPTLADAVQTPQMFSYKGDIPTTDGVQMASPRAGSIKAPSLAGSNKQGFVALPNAAPFGGVKASQYSSAGGLASRPAPGRQFSTGAPAPRQMPGLQTRNSVTRAPLKRSPLSSQGRLTVTIGGSIASADIHAENSPPESDQGSSDGSHNAASANGPPVRRNSLRSMMSTGNKARTYFTHGGRVTVEDGDLMAAQQAAVGKVEAQEKVPTPSVAAETSGKRKNKFGMFGRKG
ncbi:hypothetical protein LTR62_002819 [Meristemomyces frigidus]|uniref:Uncharacterized protein n=1 Tax=Meristemomyces frigidus TaxID=1508187 RepID=A0AAN7YKQ3_9PEZI|nr:hypothetical protein LTR62_002819 [Meristemomyces frigidus]